MGIQSITFLTLHQPAPQLASLPVKLVFGVDYSFRDTWVKQDSLRSVGISAVNLANLIVGEHRYKRLVWGQGNGGLRVQ